MATMTINETNRRLIEDARAAAGRLAEARKRVVELRARLRKAEEHAELIEARLTLSEAYSAGKNAEVRQAWLRMQRIDDPQLSAALSSLESARRELEAAEAEQQRLADEYRITVEEIHLERAYLLQRGDEED